MNKRTDGKIEEEADGCKNRQGDGKDGQMGRWMARWIDGQTNG